ncbi:hypothetical protein N431DRAFT_440786 [Stipitochalara longipes BDJ]|nr:hypothetical protein N431DRAFT_440786 [Stipitochalara longipes BDJ]
MTDSWDLIGVADCPGELELGLGMLLSDLVDVIDRPTMAGLSDPIFSFFEKAIADLSEEVNKYIDSTDVDTISLDKEKQFLHDIDDIREELSMIKTVLFQQEEVWKDFANRAWPTCWPDGPDGRLKAPEKPEKYESSEQFAAELRRPWIPGSIKNHREIWTKIQKPQTQFAKFK